jgi:hypothetical protein
MRRMEDSKPPYVLNVFMSHNAKEFVNEIVRNLKEIGIVAKKDFEKKRKILESEVTAGAMAELKIDTLLKTIFEWENKFSEDKQTTTAQHLIQLYNKAIEYYSATNDMEAAQTYLTKLKTLFNND